MYHSPLNYEDHSTFSGHGAVLTPWPEPNTVYQMNNLNNLPIYRVPLTFARGFNFIFQKIILIKNCKNFTA